MFIKQENPNLLLVDAGDTIQGNTMTLGNHEVNFGLETMDQILSDAMRIADEADPALLDQFSDENKISRNLDKSDKVALAVEMGLLIGREDCTLAPKAEMKFGEMAVMFYRVKDSYKQIDVLSTNDFHGKVDAGDVYQGTPISSLNNAKPVIDFMNQVGYVAQPPYSNSNC